MTRAQDRNWFTLSRFRRPKAARRKAPLSCRLGFEPLEKRMMLSWSAYFTADSNIVPNGVSNMMLLSDGTVMAHGAGKTNTWYLLTPTNGSYTAGTWSTLP